MDSLKSKLQRRGSLINLSPSQTLWSSEKFSRDPRSSDENAVNVQVILRCRPLSDDEVSLKTPEVILCNESTREVIVAQKTAHKQIHKSFVFDKVFGPTSQQKDLYSQAAAPIVNEALEGYSCTIFAYGQTGTGKTYTMEGDARKEKDGGFHRGTGVIPRAVQQIFDILEAQNAEYSMKVTYLELYNEELTDLLAPDGDSKFSDEKTKKPVALIEDGKGAVYVRGLEEVIVFTADEIYRILEKGSARKHVAETLLNKQSNRSHSIFSITVHIKEYTSEGIEVMKCGKLNLVDLAGSENILRSGATEERAREAGEINKSLLTLGRVINALVEHSEHVPYRDSKLTRLLRDTLGGKTKTCIIATISPSAHCLEETLSTLDYSYRAKNIKNRPEVNQKVIKSELIKDLYKEIDHLKQELLATRERNGFHMPQDSYLTDDASKKQVLVQKPYNYRQKLIADLDEKLGRTQRELVKTQKALVSLEEQCRQANETIKEKDYLIFNLLGSEKALTEKALELRMELEDASLQLAGLFSKIENKNNVENDNRNLVQNYHAQLTQQLEVLKKIVVASINQQEQQLKVMEDNAQSIESAKSKATEELQAKLRKTKDKFGSRMKSLDDLANELYSNSLSTIDKVKSEASMHSSDLVNLIKEISLEANAALNDLQGNLTDQEKNLAAFTQQQLQSHSRTYQETQSIFRATVKIFKNLSTYFSKLTQMAEEVHAINDQQICALEKKLEESAACEEKKLLDKVAELLADSTVKRKELVQTAVNDLRGSAASRTSVLHQEMSNMKTCTSAAHEEWANYTGRTEKYYMEDINAVTTGKDILEKGLFCCMEKSRKVAEKWINGKESLLSMQTRTMDSVESSVGGEVEASRKTCNAVSSVALSILEEADLTEKSILVYTENMLKLDRDANAKTNFLIASSHKGIKELQYIHSNKIKEIKKNAGKYLIHEYMQDDATCPTPRERPLIVTSMESIEDLRTPSFEELLRSFGEGGSATHANGVINTRTGQHETDKLHSRFSLSAIS